MQVAELRRALRGDRQVDPMQPPKFRTNKKIPKGPPSPPAPVLHSPPRKVPLALKAA
jgi:hypothetical protein